MTATQRATDSGPWTRLAAQEPTAYAALRYAVYLRQTRGPSSAVAVWRAEWDTSLRRALAVSVPSLRTYKRLVRAACGLDWAEAVWHAGQDGIEPLPC